MTPFELEREMADYDRENRSTGQMLTWVVVFIFLAAVAVVYGPGLWR